MFRRGCVIGAALIGAGAGMLLACLLRLPSVCVLCGIGLIVLGTILMKKN